MPRVVPKTWMPNVKMERIHLHWTAGANTANSTDKKAYHILIEGDGDLVRGKSISKNARPLPSDYARHTAGANTAAIGVSLCCMAGVNSEKDYKKSTAPMTETQWERGFEVIADLAEKYNILITPTTVLTHAEVEPNLGRPQSGKWDITRLSFNSKLRGYRDIGNEMRAQVAALLDDGGVPTSDEMPQAAMLPRYRVSDVHPGMLNFRASPGGKKIGALPERTVVERLGVDGEWWRVRTRLGYVGYVHSGYLRPVDL